ncbi:MAG: hypothetical protein KKF27_20085, partial [Gammaproteobacteria bacterium]|nr:hypothetical protein [Gammaproteobacteria bacterium]
MSTTLTINQSRRLSFTATVTGLDSLSGYTAKCYFVESDGTEILTVTGSITDLVITFTVTADQMDDFPVGVHDYEVILFDGTNEYTIAEGHLRVKRTL